MGEKTKVELTCDLCKWPATAYDTNEHGPPGESLLAVATMSQLRWGGVARGPGGSYCQGFVTGLRAANVKEVQKLEQSPDSQTRALVVRSQQNALAIRTEAKQWLKTTHKVRLSKGARRAGVQKHFDSEAYAEGRTDGARYQVGGRDSAPTAPRQLP